ncbi:hypothetical protein GALL_463000 [mine drainage metagenome]|uniref:DUF4214 domain-containing protein n=1 Tax=mine drainage metagenome TaxID=410659 RepID=A0A1J5PW79_9ZZZZ
MTNLNNFDATANGDPIDWASTVKGDSFGGGFPGTVDKLTNTDLLVLQAMGYDVPSAIGPSQSSGSVALFLANLNNIATAGFSISDTSTNVATNLDTLEQNLAKLSGIALTDNNALAITSTQLGNDASVLGRIGGTYALGITLSANSTIFNASPNEHIASITGLGGLNTVVYSEPSINFNVSISGNTTTVVDNVGSYGAETINQIQRINFSDGTALALDFQQGQNSYSTVMMIGTAFGASKISTYFAPGISLYDAGQTNTQLASTIEQLGLIESQIGSTNNKAWVDFVYQNVVGVAPDVLTEAVYVGDLNNGTYTKATLLAFAAGVADVGGGTLASQIGLVGLQAHGLSYTPVA